MRTVIGKIGLPINDRKFAWRRASKRNLNKGKIVDELPPEIQFEFPGWKQISDKRKGLCYKTIWCLIILISFCTCGYQIADRISLFASNPVSIEVTVQKNESVKFPSFTVCPNFYTLEKLAPYRKLIAKEKNASFCDVSLDDLMNRFNFSLLELWSHVEVGSLLNEISLKQWTSDNRVKPSILITDLPTSFGICKKITITELIPFRKESCHLSITTKANYMNCGQYPSAFTVYIRPDRDHMKYFPFSDITLAEHYFTFMLGFTARQYSYLNTAENPCSDYTTVNTCRNKCIEKHTLKNISCKLPFFEFESSLRNCTTLAEFTRTTEYVTMSPLLLDYRNYCNCPRLCEEIIYKLGTKSTPWFIKSTEVKFYFEDNQIDFMREYYSYTIIPFLCDLGGNLGLFLGLCIPTVLENIENVIVYFNRKMFCE